MSSTASGCFPKKPFSPPFAGLLASTLVFVSLTLGVWMAFEIPLYIPKAVIAVSAVLLLISVLLSKPAPWAPLSMLVPIISIAIIGAFNASSWLAAAVFSWHILGVSILFVVGWTLGIRSPALAGAAITAFLLIVLQPSVALIKIATIGVNEKFWIGTLHQSAGQLGLLLPMIGIAIILPIAVFRFPLAVALIPGFVLFGIAGEKRATVLVLPAMILFATALCITSANYKRDIKARWLFLSVARRITFLLVLVLSALGAIGGSLMMIPSLDPSQECIAALDRVTERPCSRTELSAIDRLEYATSYIHDYVSRKYDSPMNSSKTSLQENTNIQLGRLAIVLESFKLLASLSPIEKVFGLGGAATNPSPILGANRQDVFFQRTGLRGPIPFALTITVETGFVGLALSVLWFGLWSLMLFLKLRGRGDLLITIVVLSAIGAHATIGFDFFLYSSVGWTAMVLSPCYFLLVGAALSSEASTNDAVGIVSPECAFGSEKVLT